MAAFDAELSRVSQPTAAYAVTAARILELAKTAHFLYSEQDLEGRRKLLDSLLSNCTSIAELFVRLTLSRSTCYHEVEKPRIRGDAGIRTP